MEQQVAAAATNIEDHRIGGYHVYRRAAQLSDGTNGVTLSWRNETIGPFRAVRDVLDYQLEPLVHAVLEDGSHALYRWSTRIDKALEITRLHLCHSRPLYIVRRAHGTFVKWNARVSGPYEEIGAFEATRAGVRFPVLRDGDHQQITLALATVSR